MTLQFINDYIEQKMNENEEYIRITFYDLRVKHNLSEEDTAKFLTLVKTRLENMGYKVYLVDDRYEYNQALRRVQINELLVAIKDSLINE